MREIVLGIIPARRNSVRVPNKNLKLLSGIPLIQYAVNAAKGASLIDKIISTTDSIEIINYFSSDDSIILHKRPKKLGLDKVEMYDVVYDVIKKYNSRLNPSILMLIQPTSPFRSSKHIDAAIRGLKKRQECNSVVSVTKLDHRFMPQKLGVLDATEIRSLGMKKYIYNPNILNKRHLYYRNGAIYGARVEKFIAKKTLLPNPVHGYQMEKEFSLDIDDSEDFHFAEFKLNGFK